MIIEIAKHAVDTIIWYLPVIAFLAILACATHAAERVMRKRKTKETTTP